ncbi:MAG: AlpA family phage regulatory protein [Thiobacillus sp.]|jgi:prophage regulatory protein|nr:AlpA family phage regulatory protein [Thiobacillus sp.]
MVSQIQSVRPKQAAELLGIGVATFWRWNKERHDFPKPRKLSSRCTVFDAGELIAWRDAQGKAPQQ